MTMAAEPFEIEVDGRTCAAQPGETLLAVARRAGLFIPSLCAHPLLHPYGACRLCLVEVEQKGRRRLVAACAYPVQADLVVRTTTEKIAALRRGILELYLARCPDSSPLRELAARLGVAGTRFPVLGKREEKCILCGLCVRVCSEVVGAAAISFAGRGRERRVDSPFSLGADDCAGCCACVAVCPTGAITADAVGDTLHLVPFKTSLKLQRCVSCGTPIAPARLLESVRIQASLPFVAGLLCPGCRAARRARVLAAVSRGACP